MSSDVCIFLYSTGWWYDAGDTAQLLIFIQGVNDRFDIITELPSIEAMKGTLGDRICMKGCQQLLNDISYSGTS